MPATNVFMDAIDTLDHQLAELLIGLRDHLQLARDRDEHHVRAHRAVERREERGRRDRFGAEADLVGSRQHPASEQHHGAAGKHGCHHTNWPCQRKCGRRRCC